MLAVCFGCLLRLAVFGSHCAAARHRHDGSRPSEGRTPDCPGMLSVVMSGDEWSRVVMSAHGLEAGSPRCAQIWYPISHLAQACASAVASNSAYTPPHASLLQDDLTKLSLTCDAITLIEVRRSGSDRRPPDLTSTRDRAKDRPTSRPLGTGPKTARPHAHSGSSQKPPS